MKRITIPMMALCLMTAFVPKAQAQNDLPDDAYYHEYAEQLAASKQPDALQTKFGFERDDIEVKNPFATISEAVNALPAFPTVAQVVSDNEAPAIAWQTYLTAVLQLGEKISAQVAAIQLESRQKVNKPQTKANPQQMAQMMPGNAAKMMQLMQKHGIDPTKASDKEIEAFAMKILASGELQAAMGGGSGAIDMNYSDEQEESIDKVSAIVDAFDEEMSALQQKVIEEGVYTNAKFKKMYAEMQATWQKSDACKQIYSIEKDIDKRKSEYFKTHPSINPDGSDVPNPSFWVEGRKKQNALISQFNKANAEKWCKEVKTTLDTYLQLYKKLPGIETELEAAFADKHDPIYGTLKSRINAHLVGLRGMIHVIMLNADGLPLVRSVAESDSGQ